MSSKVYFVDLEGSRGNSVLDKLKCLCETAGINDFMTAGDIVAMKLHFGELGNTRMLRPQFCKVLVNMIKERNAQPFLTDCNTLFFRNRYNAIEHLNTAQYNGYDLAGMGAPIIIADGLKGLDYRKVRASEGLEEFKIGSAIYDADKLLVVTHFKGHDDVGFGGIIKNLGMGAVARAGKQKIHSHLKPVVDQSLCNGCAVCLSYCDTEAIEIHNDTAGIKIEQCNNCGNCQVICPENSIPIRWERDDRDMQRKLVESFAAVISNKKEDCFYVSFLVDITSYCDCRSWSPTPIIGDIGILAGTDPLAVEQASYDLVDKSLHDVYTEKDLEDFTGVDGSFMLEYAEQLNLGSRDYELIKID